jgi:hypothetical protein
LAQESIIRNIFVIVFMVRFEPGTPP